MSDELLKNLLDQKPVNKSKIKEILENAKKDKKYLIHEAIEKKSIEILTKFIENCTYIDITNEEGQDLMHYALKMHYKEFYEKFKEKFQDKTKTDDYGYTYCHYAFQMDHEFIKNNYKYFVKPEIIINQQFSVFTPLEMICDNLKLLEEILDYLKVTFDDFLKYIDKIYYGIIDTEYDSVYEWKLDWFKLLIINDRYKLLSMIRKNKFSKDIHLLEKDKFVKFLKKCPDNGLGLLTLINVNFDDNVENLFLQLTKFKAVENYKNAFINSAVFLCLLTGRLEYVRVLLIHSQKYPMIFSLTTALICENLVNNKINFKYTLSILASNALKSLKDDCEKIAVEILNRISIRVILRFKSDEKVKQNKKHILYNAIEQKNNLVNGKSLIDVAYLADCKMFMGHPICQESLSRMWKENSIFNNKPRVTYYLHFLAHFVFLIIFATVLLREMKSTISINEFICYCYIGGYIIEEGLQLYSSYSKHGWRFYFLNTSNIFDIIYLSCFVLGFIMRMIILALNALPNHPFFPDVTLAGLIFFSGSLIFASIRLLYFLFYYKLFGPKLKMIVTMIVKDLFPLLVIFLIFISSFGIVFQSILFPNTHFTMKSLQFNNLTTGHLQFWSYLGDIFRRATFTMFEASYALEEIENHHSDFQIDTRSRVIIYFVLVVYLITVNVMLMNLLIALFSYTVTTIIAESEASWQLERFKFVNEYIYKSLLPPPLNVPWLICYKLIKRKIAKNKNRIINNSTTNNNYNQESILLQSQDNLHTNDNNNLSKHSDLHNSFYIIQAFVLREQRQKLLIYPEDANYSLQSKFNKLGKQVQEIYDKILKSRETPVISKKTKSNSHLMYTDYRS